MQALIIDNSDILTKLLKDAFNCLHMTTVVCHNAEGAIQALNGQSFDLICLVGAPGNVPRSELVSTIRQLEGQQTTPLVMLDSDKVDHDFEVQVTALTNFFREQSKMVEHAKSQFIADMSHELRNPLNTVVGFTDLLLTDTQDPLSEGQQAQLKQIKKAAKQLQTLITDTVNNSRAQAGLIDYKIEPVNLADIIEMVKIQLEPQADKHIINIETRYISPEYNVLADQRRLHQVIVNLLSNAIQYNPPGGWVTLKIRTLPESAMLRLLVIDTGKGIAAEDYEKVFTPFTRLGSKHETEGSGLGLLTCKYLMEWMGGAIGFESEYGEGSTFWIDLPLAPNSIAD